MSDNTPNNPKHGINLRIPVATHKRLRLCAFLTGKSVQAVIRDGIRTQTGYIIDNYLRSGKTIPDEWL